MRWFFLALICSIAPTAALAMPPVKVVASISPLAMIAAAIGQDRVFVECLVPAGSDPEKFSYAADMPTRVMGGEVFLYLGDAQIDGWAEQVVRQVPADLGVTMVDVSAGIASRRKSPYLWLSERYFPFVARHIYNAIVSHDRDNNEYLLRNYRRLCTQVQWMFAHNRRRFAQAGKLPLAVVQGEGYRDFFRQLGGVSIRAWSEGELSLSPQRRQQLLGGKFAGTKKLLFFKMPPQLDPELVAMLEQLEAQVVDLDPFGGLIYEDRDTFVELLEYNYQQLWDHL